MAQALAILSHAPGVVNIQLTEHGHGFGTKDRAERASLKFAFPARGHAAWADNAAPMKATPCLDGAIAFMDFLLMPEDTAAWSGMFIEVSDEAVRAIYNQNWTSVKK
ncbi:MAG: hypothetical protein F4X97_00755 [Boseongicola sp. SB0662_bin_57]|nr:hypothetical protein [Boseongicola sp. SB0662_bin_57]